MGIKCNMNDIGLVLSLLEQVLGSSYRLKNEEVQFFCPKCNHHKRKLQINLLNGKSHCWVCNFSAHTVPQLFYKINASKQFIKQANKLCQEHNSYESERGQGNVHNISLPKEFKPLWKKSNDIIYKHAITYLINRNIGIYDIFRYGMGYCDSGIYQNRIIIPSYNEEKQLNYFIARDIFPNSKMKYKNPPVTKNVIIFELFINWKMPLILCEGVFDAIAIKRNSIPLLGKVPSRELIKAIVKNKAKDIYIALDSDARQDALKLVELFNHFSINVRLIDLKEKDPSELGTETIWKKIDNTPVSTFSDFIKGRLYG